MGDDDTYEFPDYETYFIDCTCEHEPKDHGWVCCAVKGCLCPGHWEY